MESFGVVNRKIAAALVDSRLLEEGHGGVDGGGHNGRSNGGGNDGGPTFRVSVLETAPKHDVLGWREFTERSSFDDGWMRRLVVNGTVRAVFILHLLVFASDRWTSTPPV